MFNKLTTFRKISLVTSVVLLIVFCFQSNYNWHDILLGYLLCDSWRIVGGFMYKYVITKLDGLTTQIESEIEAKNNQK